MPYNDRDLAILLANMMDDLQVLKQAQTTADISASSSLLPADNALPSTVPPQGIGIFHTGANLTYVSDGTIMRGPQLDSGTGFPATASLPAGYQFVRTDLYKMYVWDGATWRTGQGDAGTAFPTSPPTNYQFYRTDLGIQAQYDGTRWLGPATLYPFTRVDTVQPNATSNRVMAAGWAKQSFVVVSADCRSYVQTTNNASNYWQISLRQDVTTLGTAPTTASDTAGVWTTHTFSITANTLITGGNSEINLTPMIALGTPGAIFLEPIVWVRFVYT